jgi:hypothetical protein
MVLNLADIAAVNTASAYDRLYSVLLTERVTLFLTDGTHTQLGADRIRDKVRGMVKSDQFQDSLAAVNKMPTVDECYAALNEICQKPCNRLGLQTRKVKDVLEVAPPINILGIAGSLRRQSYNRSALRAAKATAGVKEFVANVVLGPADPRARLPAPPGAMALSAR